MDDLDDLAEGQVAIWLKAPQGIVLNMAAASPAPAPPAPADDDADDFTAPTVLQSTVSIDFSRRAAEWSSSPRRVAAQRLLRHHRRLQRWLLSQTGRPATARSLTALSGARTAPCPIICADLPGLNAAVERQLGLTGVKVELFDEDFEERVCGRHGRGPTAPRSASKQPVAVRQ